MVVESQGDAATAIEFHERAIANLERSRPPDHPELAQALCNLGHAELVSDRAKAAVSHFDRCVAIFEGHEGAQPGEARARLFLAKALLAARGDRTRALELARAAKAQALPIEVEDLAQIDAWLAENE